MATPEDRLAAYFDTTQPRRPFDDQQITAIAVLLTRCSDSIERIAGRTPRTYIVLRIIERLDLLQRLLSEGFGDDWFPVTPRGLPDFLEAQVKSDILQTQHIILTKSLDLEQGQHCHYDLEEQRPFHVHSYLGSGSFGQVRVIESRVTYKQYALKTIRRRMAFGTQSKEMMGMFIAEMKIMRRLQHRHIVRYVGSYTDRHDLGLLMSPVADRDLGAYLEEASKTSQCHPTLRIFFGCLAMAVSYLHDQGIRHRDIKPKNILVHKANVLLADFGISRDVLDTTSGRTTATQRYCSPEVAASESRNESADVWSLGCVFLEMQAALQSRDLTWVKAFYENHGTGLTHYHANSQATGQLLEEWLHTTEATQGQPLAWIGRMLAIQRKHRPTAAEVISYITASNIEVGFVYSCTVCCYPPSDSESVASLEDNMVNATISLLDSYDQPASDVATLPAMDQNPRVVQIDSETNGLRNTHSIEERLSGSEEWNRVMSTRLTPQPLNADPMGGNGPGPSDLYEGQESFSRGPFKFHIEYQISSMNGRIPNIIVHCTQELLKAPLLASNARLLDHCTTHRALTQKRFSFLRDTFRANRGVRLNKEEVPLLLCWYLDSLKIPVIPRNVLRRWPRVDPRSMIQLSRHPKSIVAEHCLYILDLTSFRRDLLLYLIGFMASYASLSGALRYAKAADLARVYGPYICGSNPRERREGGVLTYLIMEAPQIFLYLGEAQREADLRRKLVERIQVEKRRNMSRGRSF